MQFSALEGEKAAMAEHVESLESEVKEYASNASANADIIVELEASLSQSLNDQQVAEEELTALTASVEELQAQKTS